jgi:MFS family permease
MRGRQPAGKPLALGCQPAGQPITRVVRTDDQVLNDYVPLALEAGTLWNAPRWRSCFFVNHQLSGLAAFVGAAAAFGLFRAVGLRIFGGVLLVSGRAGDHFGQRRTVLAGIALFTLASAACGLAVSQTQLIAARAAQGFAGAM